MLPKGDADFPIGSAILGYSLFGRAERKGHKSVCRPHSDLNGVRAQQLTHAFYHLGIGHAVRVAIDQQQQRVRLAEGIFEHARGSY